MFVKAQGIDRIVNLNKIMMVDVVERSGVFDIVADYKNELDVILAVYMDGKDAEKYFDLFCQAIVDGDELFRFPHDPKRMQEEKDDQ